MTKEETMNLAEKIVDNGISVDVVLPRKEILTIFAFTVVANVATVGIFYGMHRLGLLIKVKKEESQE